MGFKQKHIEKEKRNSLKQSPLVPLKECKWMKELEMLWQSAGPEPFGPASQMENFPVYKPHG